MRRGPDRRGANLEWEGQGDTSSQLRLRSPNCRPLGAWTVEGPSQDKARAAALLLSRPLCLHVPNMSEASLLTLQSQSKLAWWLSFPSGHCPPPPPCRDGAKTQAGPSQTCSQEEPQGPQGPDLSRVVDQNLGQCQLSRPPLCLPSRGLEAASWAQIRQNLHEFARGTQVVGRTWPEAPPHPTPGSWLVSPTPGRAGAGAGTAAGPRHDGRGAAF